MSTFNNMPQNFPFLKLFSSDAKDDSHLQKIRDRIYSLTWSRERRDPAKLDWIVSENGFKRNTQLRLIEEAPHGLNNDSTDGLPCWLLLVNKQISTDFIRFIYSVNDLDILVDLKAVHTNQNEAKLDKIVSYLQKASLQCYTRSARIRIHFPDKYPFQNLPAFNQHALDNIAGTLDEFKQLTHFSIRIVPMQGPEVYELRLATFPFYPMSMTNWSIRMLNSTTYNWDIVAGEQVHQLNLAWDLYQETGSLTATVHAADDAQKSTVHGDQALTAEEADGVSNKTMVVQKKNDSQKRKDRKLKALSTATALAVSSAASKAPSMSVRPNSTLPVPEKDGRAVSPPDQALVPGEDSSLTGAVVSKQTAGDMADSEPSSQTTQIAAGSTQPPTPPPDPTELRQTCGLMNTSAAGLNDGVMENEDNAKKRSRVADPSEFSPKESVQRDKPQMTSPISSAPSSVTLGRDQTDEEGVIHATLEETPRESTAIAEGAEAGEQPGQKKKKRRNRKKAKKPKAANTADNLSDGDDAQRTAAEVENDEAFLAEAIGAPEIIPLGNGWDGLIVDNTRDFPLAEIVEMKPVEGQDRFLSYTRANGRRGIISRSAELDRLLRQKERMAAHETERQAERTRTKEKRQLKKMKKNLIRRKEPSDSLRRSVEDIKQLVSGKQGSGPKKQLGDIARQVLEQDVPVTRDNSSEDFDSSDEDASSQEDAGSSSVQAHHPQRKSPIHLGHVETNDSHQRRQPSSSNLAAKLENIRSKPLILLYNKDDTSEDGLEPGHPGSSQADQSGLTNAQNLGQHTMATIEVGSESGSTQDSSQTVGTNIASVERKQHQDGQVEERPLIGELDDSDDADDCRSIAPQYGDEHPLLTPDDDSSAE
ncbi:hypothetical protein J7T55_003412 [Diaporthe amygdali]|uniref:uncharacterized protein n=1 Tax=Phomopsis amygdali TaxID=1214568 RepID=UPI0022FDC666|nr:uncharacterized protein J7T55_003412 [Diaporthe amygdali]KAJ0116997.1 hypothetical protein J7T55_003412 [Diaporthe amygdali]